MAVPACETRAISHPLLSWMYRYRLVEEETGRDLGPFVSSRLAFQVGETVAAKPAERYEIKRVVPTEHNEPFRAYLVVTRKHGGT